MALEISLEDVSLVYNRGTHLELKALEGVSVTFRNDESVLLLGHTGSGKSTLLKVISQLLRPSEGRVLINGRECSEPKIFMKKIGICFQFPEDQFLCETVFDEIAFASRNFNLDQIESRVMKAIEAVGLDETYLDRSPFSLSQGEARRVALASVIAHEPDLLLLDEPFIALDYQGKHVIRNFVRSWMQQRHGLVLVSHSLDHTIDLVNRVIVLESGKIVYDGSVENFIFENAARRSKLQSEVVEIWYQLLKLGEKPSSLEDLIQKAADRIIV